MANQEVTLMKGNEAIAHACIRCGADGFFGYPITPQSEIIETLALLKPWETSGMVVLQAESEVAAINMVYGGAGATINHIDSRHLTLCLENHHTRCLPRLEQSQRLYNLTLRCDRIAEEAIRTTSDTGMGYRLIAFH